MAEHQKYHAAYSQHIRALQKHEGIPHSEKQLYGLHKNTHRNKAGTKNFPYSTEFWWWTARKAKKLDFCKEQFGFKPD